MSTPIQPDEDESVTPEKLTATPALAMIMSYLGNGGLFNPELMEHDKVRDMVLLCRDELLELERQRNEAREAYEFYREYAGSQVMMSDFQNADEMRAAYNQLRTQLSSTQRELAAAEETRKTTLELLDLYKREAGELVIKRERELLATQKEAASLREDAARYRFLRWDKLVEMLELFPTCETCDVGLDYAIDAARAASPGCTPPAGTVQEQLNAGDTEG